MLSVEPSLTTMTSLHSINASPTTAAIVPALLKVGMMTQMPLSDLLALFTFDVVCHCYLQIKESFANEVSPDDTCVMTLYVFSESSGMIFSNTYVTFGVASGDITFRNFTFLTF